jgi:hypothetical protein
MHFASAIGWTPLGAYQAGTDYNCTSTMCYGVSGKGATFEAFQTALKNRAKVLGFNGKLPSGASSFASDGKIGKDTVFLTGWVAKTLAAQGDVGPAIKEIALAVQMDLLTKEQVAALVGDLLSELTPVAAVSTMPAPLPSITPAKLSRFSVFKLPTTLPKPTTGLTTKPGTIYEAATLPAPTASLQPIMAGGGNGLLIGVAAAGVLAAIGGAIMLSRRGSRGTAGIGEVDGAGAMRDYRDAMASPHNWSNKQLETLAHRMEIQAATRDSGEYQQRASKLRRLIATRRA